MYRTLRQLGAALAVGTLLVAAAPAAQAAPGRDPGRYRDRNDSPSLLDMSVARYLRLDDGLERHTVWTYEEWVRRDLKNRDSDFRLTISKPGETWPTYEVIVDYRPAGGLRAKLVRYTDSGNRIWLRRLDVSRPGPHSVSVEFDRSLLRQIEDGYDWWWSSAYRSNQPRRHCGTQGGTEETCIDYAPNWYAG